MLNVCDRSIVENMPPKVSRDIKYQAIIMSAEGHSPGYIAHSLGVSESTVKRAKKRSTEHGDIEGGYKKSGPKGKIDIYMEQVIPCSYPYIDLTTQALLKIVLNVPSAYLHEYAIVFEELFLLKISTTRIHEIFQKNGINRKKVLINLLC